MNPSIKKSNFLIVVSLSLMSSFLLNCKSNPRGESQLENTVPQYKNPESSKVAPQTSTDSNTNYKELFKSLDDLVRSQGSDTCVSGVSGFNSSYACINPDTSIEVTYESTVGINKIYFKLRSQGRDFHVTINGKTAVIAFNGIADPKPDAISELIQKTKNSPDQYFHRALQKLDAYWN